jgi:hypothetical protein
VRFQRRASIQYSPAEATAIDFGERCICELRRNNAETDQIEQAVQSAQTAASQAVIDGLVIRTDVNVVRWPDRYSKVALLYGPLI